MGDWQKHQSHQIAADSKLVYKFRLLVLFILLTELVAHMSNDHVTETAHNAVVAAESMCMEGRW